MILYYNSFLIRVRLICVVITWKIKTFNFMQPIFKCDLKDNIFSIASSGVNKLLQQLPNSRRCPLSNWYSVIAEFFRLEECLPNALLQICRTHHMDKEHAKYLITEHRLHFSHVTVNIIVNLKFYLDWLYIKKLCKFVGRKNTFMRMLN